ncbi:hypothetical protein CSA80_02620 [Candidatus Saccharibacteria bacterium]|nr:MAG: hypothetical protein CR973_02735 [Candidatus Saccharibacteria bacterium]PID98990.1 MAG: hypothetical protein CSA80_02620 [Candidatus Saccharibacteria bacterium]
MLAAAELSPLLNYASWPLFVAIGLICLVVAWFIFVYWLTRKKPDNVLANLPPQEPIPVDLTQLKAAALEKIGQVEQNYAEKRINARTAHQYLSAILRDFASQAAHMPLHTMTLAELKRTQYGQLATTIGEYYRPEFAAISSGSVADASAAARKVVSEWL